MSPTLTLTHSTLTPPTPLSIEPLLTPFLTLLTRTQKNHTYLQHQSHLEELKRAKQTTVQVEEDVSDGEGDEYAREHDIEPKDWKEQDHYRVMGLSHLRWRASATAIKKAYGRQILRHHPDKKAGKSGNANDDAYFKCLQKAYELLSDETRRKQFDSVDPTFDDEIPDENDVKTSGSFFETFRPVFESNGRFSKIQPVPELGDEKSTREEVENFYNFWFSFDSWRTFEYKDDDQADSDNRDDKRHVEKKNKAQRQRLKKEDNGRINGLIDTAMKLDPRIQKFKADERQAKEDKKLARENERNKDKNAAAKAEAERQAAEAEAASKAKVAADAEKAEKKRVKDLTRKEKREVKLLLEKYDYFRNGSGDISQMESSLNGLEQIFTNLQLDDLERLRHKMDSTVNEAKDLFDAAKTRSATAQSESAPSSSVKWTDAEVSELKKALEQFPNGTNNRWKTVADEIAKKTKQPVHPVDDVIDQVRVLTAKQEASQKKESSTTPVASTTPAPTADAPKMSKWSPTEQSSLESALKKFPAHKFPGKEDERYSKISGEVKGRSVEECKMRVRELAAAKNGRGGKKGGKK